MWRALKYLLIVGVLAFVFVWFADRPGSFSLEWQGYRVDSTAAGLFAMVFLVALVAAALYRFWGAVVRTPKNIKRAFAERKRDKGYQALTRGMVAVAAGDASEAQKYRRKAEGLLQEPPLTMLLSAQAAQLAGDDKAAERFFTAMLDNPETKFLGLRGLLVQATKAGDRTKALEIAEQAKRLKPDSVWLNENLFQLQTSEGRWADARQTLIEAKKRKQTITENVDSKTTTLDILASRDSDAADHEANALKLAKAAVKKDPKSSPAALHLAGIYTKLAQPAKSAKVLEQAWMQQPHPSYLKPYLAAKKPKDAMEALKLIQRLVRNNPKNRESLLAIAEAALAAQLWGEARGALKTVIHEADGRTQRVCHLMADLEEQEKGDLVAARKWLLEASMANPDPRWTCSSCGNAVEEWSGLCANCGSFDSFRWEAPRHVAQIAGPAGTGTLPATTTADGSDSSDTPHRP